MLFRVGRSCSVVLVSILFLILSSGCDHPVSYDPNGFDPDGIHQVTGTRFDPLGFDRAGFHQATGTRFDPLGFDRTGIHESTGTRFDLLGFDREGLHQTTGTQFDQDQFDRTGKHEVTGTQFDPNGFDRTGNHQATGRQYNPQGFDKAGLHETTGGQYDPNGFNRAGNHQTTGKPFDPQGFDRIGLHKATSSSSDPNGFDRQGIHQVTGNQYDPNHFDWKGMHEITGTPFDPYDFDQGGNHGKTGSHLDPNGFNRSGNYEATGLLFDPNGFDRIGIHQTTTTLFDPNGFDRSGIHQTTTTLFDLNRFDRAGVHQDTGSTTDPNGFDRAGIHPATGTPFDPNEFDRRGIHRTTGTQLDWNRFDRAGIHQFTGTQFDENKFDQAGNHQDTGTLFDPNGFDRRGAHRTTGTQFDQNRFDRAGIHRFTGTRFDEHRFDQAGNHELTGAQLDANGFNRDGFYRDSGNRFAPNGFDWEGFNARGFNAGALHRNGTRYDVQGFDANGYNRAGFRRDRQHRLDIELAANRVPNAATYLQLVDFDRLVMNPFEKIDIARVIDRHLPGFFQLNPTFPEIMLLLTRNGGFEVEWIINFSMAIKDHAFVENKVTTVGEFTEIMNSVFDGAFEDPDYLLQNSLLIADRIQDFIQPERTLAELRNLKTFTNGVTLIDGVPRRDWINAIEHLIQIKIAAHAEEILPRLRARVLEKIKEVKPDCTGDIRYFLLRDPQLWETRLEDHNEGQCPICLDDLTEEAPGVRIQPGHEGADDRLVCQDCLLHKECLLNHIRAEIGENRFPTRCPVFGHPHELPLNAAKLADLGATPEEIQLWEVRTLLAYYRALNGGQDENHICPTPNCINPLFADEAIHPAEPDDHHVRCAVCEIEHCYACQENNHTRVHHGRACKDMVRPDWMDPANQEMRPCPYCKTPFAKIDGCNAVRCQQCGAAFNYNKGALRWQNPQHTITTHNHDFGPVIDRQYRVDLDDDYAPGRESAYEGVEPILTQQEARQTH